MSNISDPINRPNVTICDTLEKIIGKDKPRKHSLPEILEDIKY